jgi:hypothetical protein
MCGGRAEADRAAEELKTRFGFEPVLVDVGKGKFEVLIGGEPLFSKEVFGRFPHAGELYRLLRGRRKGE